MAKYKDSFQTQSESLATGGRGIFTAIENEDMHTQTKKAPPPEFDKPERSSGVPTIRTLADDMQSAISAGGVSLSSQVKSGNVPKKKKEVEKPKEEWSDTPPKAPTPPQKKEAFKYERPVQKTSGKPYVFILIAVLLIFGGSLYVFTARQEVSLGSFSLPKLPKISFSGIFNRSKPSANQEVIDVAPKTLVEIDRYERLILSSSTAKTEFEQEARRLGNDTQSGVTAIFINYIPTDEEGASSADPLPVSAGEFFRLLETSVSTPFTRSLEDYTLGTISSAGRNSELFIVAKVRSYDDSFAALLDWEPEMPADLYGSFHRNSRGVFGSSTFRDISINSTDARELTTNSTTEGEVSGSLVEPVIIYGFVDSNTLIITQSRDSFGEITKRISKHE